MLWHLSTIIKDLPLQKGVIIYMLKNVDGVLDPSFEHLKHATDYFKVLNVFHLSFLNTISQNINYYICKERLIRFLKS